MHRQRFRLVPLQAFPGLDPQVQLQLAQDLIHAFVVSFIALHVAQIRKIQAKAPDPFVRRQTSQPVSIFFVFIAQNTALSKTRLADLKHAATQCHITPMLCDCAHGHLAHSRRP
jgi:hypothetical protein